MNSFDERIFFGTQSSISISFNGSRSHRLEIEEKVCFVRVFSKYSCNSRGACKITLDNFHSAFYLKVDLTRASGTFTVLYCP